MIIETGGVGADEGFLMAGGTVHKRTAYQALFKRIGTKYNTGGEGADEFRLPNIEDHEIKY